MSRLYDTMQKFSAAEEFLDFLGVDYAPQVVHVNRLHILKRFQQYLARDPVAAGMAEAEERAAYRDRLERAYLDFVASNAQNEKVFKVFQDAEGKQTVSVGKLRTALREHLSDR